jgi:predicted negative regulator of RcsB-dependent stress response
MAKIKLERKKQLREPDEFVTMAGRILQYALQHRIRIAAICGVVVTLFLLVSFSLYHADQKETKAFTAYHEVMERYTALAEKQGPPDACQALETDFQNFQQQYSGTVAGSMAAIRFGGICMDGRAYEQAVQWYLAALDTLEPGHSCRNVFLSALGHAYIAKKDYNAAIPVFEQIADGTSSLMKAEAFYLLGGLYDRTEQMEKSTTAYQTVVSRYADSMYFELANEKIVKG